MAKAYLDKDGLTYLWSKIKDYVDTHSGGGTVGADYVTDEGTSSSWHYRKWNSGKIEAWYKGTVSCSAATAVNNVYRSSYSLSIPSGIFSSAPNVNMSIDQSASTLLTAVGYASSKTAISGYVFRTGSQTSTYTATVAIYAWLN